MFKMSVIDRYVTRRGDSPLVVFTGTIIEGTVRAGDIIDIVGSTVSENAVCAGVETKPPGRVPVAGMNVGVAVTRTAAETDKDVREITAVN